MQHNVVLAGVGGQGILTIARGLSIAALEKGLSVKQAEVHGMSQRGGAVYSHVRLSDKELFSDLIGVGKADILLSVEPLEALRHIEYLREDGVVIANTNAVTNIQNYPPIEEVLDKIATLPHHILIDMEKLGRAAGSPLSANMVALGAASLFLSLGPDALEQAIGSLFEAKGERIVAMNRRAFRFGRTAANAYLDGIHRGGSSRSIRQWIDTLSAEHLASDELAQPSDLELREEEDRLSGAEAHAFESTLVSAYQEGRRQLYEHEVYALVELVGAISPPRYSFVPKGSMIAKDVLAQFPGDRVVLKLVSPDVVHKSDADAVQFVAKSHETVRREIDRMVERHSEGAHVAGVLVVEYVEAEHRGFGGELFVGIRSTREFGPVIAAGLGGVETEYLASKMRPGVAVAKAVAMDTSAEQFLELFKSTAAYEVLAGKVRGHRRIVSDGELLRCFRAFISIARRFCVDRGEEGPDIGELEVNPFAFRGQRLIPLDGRAQMRTASQPRAPRPLDKVESLLVPRTIGFVGVSSKSQNFGRIILQNVLACGFDPCRLVVVKDGESEIEGVQCVPDIAAAPDTIDLLVIAAPAVHLPGIIDAANASGKVRSGIIISGGVGETEGSGDLLEQVSEAIRRGRERPDGGVVFLGPNCMGLQSRPGNYDTFFIPHTKLDNRWSAEARPVALLSQSGAFIISRLSKLGTLDPALAVSIGNQMDVTVSDLMRVVGEREDIAAVGVYMEGFSNLDGLEFLRAVDALSKAGKTVVFYKAGRTESGRSAAAGHTASVAGDYDICQAAAQAAGAIVVEEFEEFERQLELATMLAGKTVWGNRVFAMSNAGMETVGMADAVEGDHAGLRLPELSDGLRDSVRTVLAKHRLDGLVNPRNPLDVTPMASEVAYAELARLVLASPEIDAAVVSCVPLAPHLHTTTDEVDHPDALASTIPELSARSEKPLVFVVDSGRRFDALADRAREAGVPVFRSADQAIRSLGRYLEHRLRS